MAARPRSGRGGDGEGGGATVCLVSCVKEKARSVVVQVPMAGLRIGEQMAWLDRRVGRRDAGELASGDLLD